MRRGDLNARHRAECRTANAHHRRRDRREHECHRKALGGKDFRCGEGELLGPVAGVAADHYVRSGQAMVREHLGRPPRWRAGRRRGSSRSVRPRSGPRRPAVPNVSGRANRSSSSSSLQRRQFSGGLRIGIVSDPLLRGRRGPRRSHTASVPALRVGVSQLAEHRGDEHQQVELERRQVVAHGRVQPGIPFGAVGLQQRGTRRGDSISCRRRSVSSGRRATRSRLTSSLMLSVSDCTRTCNRFAELGRGGHARCG